MQEPSATPVIGNGLVEFVVPVDWPTGIPIANRLYVLVGIGRKQRSARTVRLEYRPQVNLALLVGAGPNFAPHEAQDAPVNTIF